MHTGIELFESAFSEYLELQCTHHDCLALVLEDVAGASNLVTAAQAQEHQLIGWVYGLNIFRLHCRMLSLGSHLCLSNWLGGYKTYGLLLQTWD